MSVKNLVEELKKISENFKNQLLNSFIQYSFERYYRRRYETKYKLIDLLKSLGIENCEVIHVSELIKCKQQCIFEEHYIKTSEDYAKYCFRVSMIFGDAIEREVIDLMKLPKGYITFKKIEVGSKTYVIVGSCDAIFEDYVIEIKARTKFEQDRVFPTPLQIAQTKLYAWLYNKQYGLLILVHPNDVNVIVEKAYTDNEVRDLILTWSSPRYPFECIYCTFKDICKQRQMQVLITDY